MKLCCHWALGAFYYHPLQTTVLSIKYMFYLLQKVYKDILGNISRGKVDDLNRTIGRLMKSWPCPKLDRDQP